MVSEDNNGINHKHRWTGEHYVLMAEQENRIPGFLFVFLICFIVPPLTSQPPHKNISSHTTLQFSSAAMNCDESINTDDVPTPGNISQTRPGLGVKVSTSIRRDYRPWRRDLIKQRNKQT